MAVFTICLGTYLLSLGGGMNLTIRGREILCIQHFTLDEASTVKGRVLRTPSIVVVGF